MTKKQAEIIYKWANAAYIEDELDGPEMLELTQMLFSMMEKDEPMTEAEVTEVGEWAWEANSNNLEAESRDQLFRLMLHEMIDTVSPIKIERMIDLVEKSDDELDEPISKPESKPTSYPTEPEAIYTGGGFWLAASYTEPSVYAVIGNEDEVPELCYYRKDGDADEYECNQMIKEVELHNMTEDELKLYQKLYSTLWFAINNDREIRH